MHSSTNWVKGKRRNSSLSLSLSHSSHLISFSGHQYLYDRFLIRRVWVIHSYLRACTHSVDRFLTGFWLVGFCYPHSNSSRLAACTANPNFAPISNYLSYPPWKEKRGRKAWERKTRCSEKQLNKRDENLRSIILPNKRRNKNISSKKRDISFKAFNNLFVGEIKWFLSIYIFLLQLQSK